MDAGKNCKILYFLQKVFQINLNLIYLMNFYFFTQYVCRESYIWGGHYTVIYITVFTTTSKNKANNHRSLPISQIRKQNWMRDLRR